MNYNITISNKFKSIDNLIGNTPLLEINFKYKGELRRIFAKAEQYNLTGSIKDRMAIHIIKEAYNSGDLKKDDTIVEATSGNTGIAFSAIGSALGHKVIIFMPDWMSKERVNLIESYGANIHLVSSDEGGFIGSIKMTEDLAEKSGNIFLPCQFSNEKNSEAHYLTTGPEIWNQLKTIGLKPDAIVAGVGTGGTIMGIGKYFKENSPNIKIYPLEPLNSPTLSTGHKVGKHRIEGISDDFIPSIVKLDQLDDILSVDDGDAIIMAQKIASQLGVGVGISSGANFLGALMAQELLGKDSTVVTIFSDDNKKYLSTDLMKEETIKDGFLSKDIELLNIQPIIINNKLEE